MTSMPSSNNVLRSEYQKSVATYWNQEKAPVNILLGDFRTEAEQQNVVP